MKRAARWLADVVVGIVLLLFFWVPALLPKRKREPDPHEGGV